MQSKYHSDFTNYALQRKLDSDFTKSALHCKHHSYFQKLNMHKEETLENWNKQHFINLCMSYIERMLFYCLTNYIREIPKGDFNENINQEQRIQNKGVKNSRGDMPEDREDYNDNSNDNYQNSNRKQLQEDEGEEEKVEIQTKTIMFNILNIYDDSEEEYKSTKTMIYKTYNTKGYFIENITNNETNEKLEIVLHTTPESFETIKQLLVTSGIIIVNEQELSYDLTKEERIAFFRQLQ